MAGGIGGPMAWALRPAGEHAALRRLARAAGLHLRALAVQRLVPLARGPRRRAVEAALGEALAQPLRVFTSPAAVRFAAASGIWAAARTAGGGLDLAVGAGTAEALRRAGAGEVLSPARMDSEGLLALPALAGLREGQGVGLVTAPGGRGLIAAALRERGARLQLAEVYARRPLPGGARRLAALLARPAPLATSSAEALHALHVLVVRRGEPARQALLARPLVVSSARLAASAAALGFADVHRATGPDPAALVHALLAAGAEAGPYNGRAAASRALP